MSALLQTLFLILVTSLALEVHWISTDNVDFSHPGNWNPEPDFYTQVVTCIIDVDTEVILSSDKIPNIHKIILGSSSSTPTLKISAALSVENFVWHSGSLEIDTKLFNIHSTLDLKSDSSKELSKGTLILFGSLEVHDKSILTLGHGSKVSVRHVYNKKNKVLISHSSGVFEIANTGGGPSVEFFVPVELKHNSHLKLGVSAHLIGSVVVSEGAVLEFNEDSEINNEIELKGENSGLKVDGCTVQFKSKSYYSAVENDLLVYFNFRDPPSNGYFSDFFGNFFAQIRGNTQHESNYVSMPGNNDHLLSSFRPAPTGPFTIYMDYDISSSKPSMSTTVQFGLESNEDSCNFATGFRRDRSGLLRFGYLGFTLSSVSTRRRICQCTPVVNHHDFEESFRPAAFIVDNNNVVLRNNYEGDIKSSSHSSSSLEPCQRTFPLDFGCLFDSNGGRDCKLNVKFRDYRVYSKALSSSDVTTLFSQSGEEGIVETTTVPEFSGPGFITLTEGSFINLFPKELSIIYYEGSSLFENQFTCSDTTTLVITGDVVVNSGERFSLGCKLKLEGSIEIFAGEVVFAKGSQFDGSLIVKQNGRAKFEEGIYIFSESSVLGQDPENLVTDSSITLNIYGKLKVSSPILFNGLVYVLQPKSVLDVPGLTIVIDDSLVFEDVEFSQSTAVTILSGDVTFSYDEEATINLSSFLIEEGSVTFNNGDLKANTITINSESAASASFTNTKLGSLSDFTSNSGNIEFNYEDDLTISANFIIVDSDLDLKNPETTYSFNRLDLSSSTRKGNGNLIVNDLSFSGTTFTGNSQTKCTESCDVINGETNIINVKHSHELIFDGNGNMNSESLIDFEINSANFILNEPYSFTTNSKIIVSTSSETDFQILGTLSIEEEGSLAIEDLFDLKGTIIVNGKLELDSDSTIDGTLKVLDGGEAVFKGDSYTFNQNSKLEVHPNTLILQEPIELTIEGTYKGIGSITHSHGKLTFTSGSKVDTGDFIVKTSEKLTFSRKLVTLLFDYENTSESIDITSIELKEGSVTFNNGDLKANTITINSESAASASFTNTKLGSLIDFSSNNGNIEFNYEDDLTISANFNIVGSDLDLKNPDSTYSFNSLDLSSSTRKGNGNLIVKELSFSCTTFTGNSQTKCTESCDVINGETNIINVKHSHELIFDGNGNMNSESLIDFEINSANFILNEPYSFTTNSKIIVSTSSETDFQILGTLSIEEEGSLAIEDLFDLKGTIIVNGKLELDSDSTIDGTLKVLDGGEAVFKGDSYTFNQNSKLEVHPNTLILQEPIELTIEGTYKGIGSITHSHGKLTFTSGSKVDTGDFIIFESLDLLKIETGDVTFDYENTSESIDITSIELKEGSVTFNNGDLKANTITINSESAASASFTNTKLGSLIDFSSNNGNIEFNYEDDLTISANFNIVGSDLDLKNPDSTYSFNSLDLSSSTRKGNGNLIVKELSFSCTTFTGNSQTKCTESCDVINGETNIINVKHSHELIFDGNGNMNSESLIDFEINSANFILNEPYSFTTNSKIIVSTSSETDFQILGTLSIEEEGSLAIEDLFDLKGTIIVNGKLELDSDSTIDGTLKVLDGGEAVFKGDSYTFNQNSKLEVHPNTLILQEPIELTIEGTYKGIGSITHSHGKLTFTSGSKVDTGDFIVKTSEKLTFSRVDFESLDLLKIETGDVTFDYENTSESIDITSIELKEGSVTFNNGDLKANTITINSESAASASFTNTKLGSLIDFSSNNGNIEFNYEDDLTISANFNIVGSDLDLKNPDSTYSFNSLDLSSSTRKGNGNLIVKELSFSCTTFTGNSQTKCTESCDVINGETNIINVKDSHELIFDGNGNMNSESLIDFEINSANFILNEPYSFTTNSKIIVSTSSETDFQILGTLSIEEEGSLAIEDLFDLKGTIIVNGKLELDSDSTIDGTIKVSDGGEAVFKGDSYTFNENSKLEVHPNTLILQEPIELTIEGTYKGIGSITHSQGQLTFTPSSKVDTGDFIVKTSEKLTFSRVDFESLDLLKIETGDVTFDYENTSESIDITSIELKEGSVTFNNGDLKANSFTINSESAASASFTNTKLGSLSDFTSNNGNIEFNYEDDLTISANFNIVGSDLDLKNPDSTYSFNSLDLSSSTRKGNGNLIVKELSFSCTTFTGNSQTKCTESCDVINCETNIINVKDSHELIFDGNGNMNSESLIDFEINSANFILNEPYSFTTNSKIIVSTSSETDFQILGTLSIEEEGSLAIEDLFDLKGTFIVNGKLELDSDSTIDGTIKVSDGGEAVFKGDSYTFNENSKLEVHPNTLILQEPIELTIEGTYKGIGSITHSQGHLTFTPGSKVDTGDFIVKTSEKLTFSRVDFESLDLLKIETGDVTFDYENTSESINITSIELKEGSVTFNNGDLKANSFTINSESAASASFTNTKLGSLSDFTSNNGNIEFNYEDDLTISANFNIVGSDLDLKNPDSTYSFNSLDLSSSTRKGNGNLIVNDLSFSGTTFTGNSQTKCTESCDVINGETNIINVKDSHELIFDSNGNMNSESLIDFEINSANFILNEPYSFTTNSKIIVSTSSETDFQILGTLSIEEEGSLAIEDLFDLKGTIIVNGKLELDSSNTIDGTLKVLDGGEAIFKGDSYTFNENSKLEVHPNTLILQEPIELTIEGTYKGIGSITHSHGKLTFTSGSKVDTGDFIVKTSEKLTFSRVDFESLDLLKIETGHVTFDYENTSESINITSIELKEGSVTFNNGDLKANTITINSESAASASFTNTKLGSLSDFTSNNGNIEFNYEDDLTISASFNIVDSDLDLKNPDSTYSFNSLHLSSSTRKGNGNLIVNDLSFSGTTFTGNSQTECTESCDVINGETNIINVKDSHELIFDANGNIDSESLIDFEINSANFILNEPYSFTTNSKIIVSTSSETDFQVLGTLSIEEEGSLAIEDLFDLKGTIIANGKLELDYSNTIDGTLKVLDGGEAVFKGDSYTFNQNSKLEVHPNTLILQEPIELTIEGTYKGIGSITHSHGKLTFTSGSKVDTGDFIVKTSEKLTFSRVDFESLDLLKIETGDVTFDYENTSESIDITSIELKEGSVTFNNGDLKANTITINSESAASASFTNTKLGSLSDFTSNNGNIEFNYEDDLTISASFNIVDSDLDLKNPDSTYSFNSLHLSSSTRKGNGNLIVNDLSFSGTTFTGNSQTECTESCDVINGETNIINVKDSHELIFDANGNIDSESLIDFEINSANFILNEPYSFTTNSKIIVSTSSETDFQVLGTLSIEEEGSLAIEDLFDLKGTIIVNGKLELDSDSTIDGTLKVADGGEAVFKGDSYAFNENSKLEVHPNTLILQEPIELTIEGTYKGIGSITHSHGKLTFTPGSKVDTGDFIVKTSEKLTFSRVDFESLDLLKIETGDVTFDYENTSESIDITSIELKEGSVTFNNGDLKANTITINSESAASASFTNTKLGSLSDFTSNNGNIEFNYEDDLTISANFNIVDSDLDLKNPDSTYSFNSLDLSSSTRKGNGNLIVNDLSFSGTTFTGNSQTKCTESCDVINGETNIINVKHSHELIFDGNGNMNSESLIDFEINSANFILNEPYSFTTNSKIIVSTSSETDFQILGTLNIEEEGSLAIEDLFDLKGTIIVNGKLELDSSNTIDGTLKVLDGGEAIFKGDSYTFNENSKLEVHPNTLILQEPIELTIKGTYKGIGSITHSHGKLTFTSGSKVDTGDFIVETSEKLTFSRVEFKSLDSLEIQTGDVTFDYENTSESINIDSIELKEGSVTFNNGDLKANSFTINSESAASASFTNTKLGSLSDFTSNNGNIEFNYEDDLTISANFNIVDSDLDLKNPDTTYSFNSLHLSSSTRKGNGNLIVNDLSFSGTTFTSNSQTECTESCDVINGETNIINVKDSHELIFDSNGNMNSESLIDFEINSANFILNEPYSFTTNSKIIVSTSSETDFQVLGTLSIEEEGSLAIEDLFDLKGTIIVNGKLELDSSNTIDGTLKVLDGGEAIFKGDSYTFNENSKLEVHPNTLILQEPIELTIEGTYKGIGSITHSHGKLTFTSGSKVDTGDFIVKTSEKLTFSRVDFESLDLLKIETGHVTFDYENTSESINITSIELKEGSVTFNNGDLKANTITINSESAASASFTNTKLGSLSDFTSNNGNIEFNYEDDLTISASFNIVGSDLDLKNPDSTYSFNSLDLSSSTRKGNGNLIVNDLSFSGTTFTGNSQTKCTESCDVINGETNIINVKDSHELIFDSNGNMNSESLIDFEINSANFILNEPYSFTTNSKIIVSTSSETDFQILGTLSIEEEGSLAIEDLFDLKGTIIVNGKLELDSDSTIDGTLKVADGGEAVFKGDSYTFNENSKLEVHPNTLILQEPIELTIKGTYKGIGSITHSHGKLTFTSGSKVDTGDFIVETSEKLTFSRVEFKSLDSLQIQTGHVTFDYENTSESINIDSIELKEGSVTFNNGDLKANSFTINSESAASASFTNTKLGSLSDFTSNNGNIEFNYEDDLTISANFNIVDSDLDLKNPDTTYSFNRLDLSSSTRKGNGNLIVNDLSFSGTTFTGNSQTKCTESCDVINLQSGLTKISNHHQLVIVPFIDLNNQVFELNTANLTFESFVNFSSFHVYGFLSQIECFSSVRFTNVWFLTFFDDISNNNSLFLHDEVSCFSFSHFKWIVEVQGDFSLGNNSTIIFFNELTIHALVYIDIDSFFVIDCLAHFLPRSNLTSDNGLVFFENANVYFSGYWTSSFDVLNLNNGSLIFGANSGFSFNSLQIENMNLGFYFSVSEFLSIYLLNSVVLFCDIPSSLYFHSVEVHYSEFSFSDIKEVVTLGVLEAFDTVFYFNNLKPFLLIDELVSDGSTFNFNTGQLCVISNVSESNSLFTGADPYIFQDEQVFDVDINYGSSCCPTENCRIIIPFDYAWSVNDYLDVEVIGTERVQRTTDQDVFDLYVRNIWGRDEKFEFLFLNISVNDQFVLYATSIAICPFNVEFLFAPPTSGGIMPIRGTNFGVYHDIFVAIVSLNFYELATIHSHNELFITLPYGDSCHNLTFFPENRPSVDDFFCYGSPSVHEFAPNEISFVSDLSFSGNNLGLAEAIEIVFINAHANYTILSAYHLFVLVEFNPLCLFEGNSFSLYFNVGTHSSNTLSIPVVTPSFEVVPLVLPTVGGTISIHGESFSTLFNDDCLPDGGVFCDGAEVSFAALDSNSLIVTILTIQHSSSLSCYLKFTLELVSTFDLVLASVTVSDFDQLCYLGFSCEVTVVSDDSAFDFSLYTPEGSNLDIVTYVLYEKSATIRFSALTTSPRLSLCSNEDICFEVSFLPSIVEITSVNPTELFFFGASGNYQFSISGTNLNSFRITGNYLSIGNLSIKIESVSQSELLIFTDQVSLGFHGIKVETQFSIVTLDFGISFVFPLNLPILFTNSSLVLFYEISQSHLAVSLSFSSRSFDISNGFNDLDLHFLNSCPYHISVSNDQNSFPLLVECFAMDSLFPSVVFSNHVSTVKVPIPNVDLDITYDVTCDVLCTIHNYFTDEGFLLVSFLVSDPGTVVFTLAIYQGKHVSSKELYVNAVPEPVFNLLSPQEFFFYQNATVNLLIDNYIVSGSFYWNSSLASFVEDRIGSLDLVYLELPFVSNGGFSSGTHHLNLYWGNVDFTAYFIMTITIHFVRVFEVLDTIPLLTSRDFTLKMTHLPVLTDKLSLFCRILEFDFPSIGLENELICKNVLVSQIMEDVTVFLINERGAIIDSITAEVDTFFDDACFVPDSSTLVSLSRENFLPSQYLGRIDTIIDGFRCCGGLLEECSIFLEKNSTFSIIFDGELDIRSLTVTVNSDCTSASRRTSPLELLHLNSDWSCHSIPNGFGFASQCITLFSELVVVESLELVAFQDIFLLEIEVNGFDPHACFLILETGQGVTSISNTIEIDTFLAFGELIYGNFSSLLKDYAVESSHNFESKFEFHLDLLAPDCFYPSRSYSTLYFPGNPVSMVFLRDDLLLDSNSISIPVQCHDSFGFLTSCSNITSFEVVESSVGIIVDFCGDLSCSVMLTTISGLGRQFVFYSIGFVDEVFLWEFNLTQESFQYLSASVIDVVSCSSPHAGSHTCSLATVELVVHQVLPTSTETVSYQTSLEGSTIKGNGKIRNSYLVPPRTIRVITSPLESVALDIEYDRMSTSIQLTSVDCVFPMVHNNGICICAPGYALNSAQSCDKCPRNSFSNSLTEQQCHSCPLGRITFNEGSSSLDDCFCQRNFVEIDGECVRCPDKTTCEYGHISSFENGFLFSSEFLPFECVLRHLCRNNTCIQGHEGEHCLDCEEGFDAFGTEFAIGYVHLILLILIGSTLHYLAVDAYNRRIELAQEKSLKTNVPSKVKKEILKQYSFSFFYILICYSEVLFNGITTSLSFIFSFYHFLSPRFFHWSVSLLFWLLVYWGVYLWIHKLRFGIFPKYLRAQLIELYFAVCSLGYLPLLNRFSYFLIIHVIGMAFMIIINRNSFHVAPFCLCLFIYLCDLYLPYFFYKCLTIIALLISGILNRGFTKLICLFTTVWLLVYLTKPHFVSFIAL
ncbi:hypothetical protein P9112_011926 [Eukaryota sp. TZLM1-RC]